MFWFFGREARGILAPQPGIEPTPSALEGEVLTTGPPGKSLNKSFLIRPHWQYEKSRAQIKSKREGDPMFLRSKLTPEDPRSQLLQ